MSFLRRVFNALRPGRLERDLDDELAFHLHARTEDNKAQGMSAREARRDAAQRLGDLWRVREQSFDANVIQWLSALRQDVRYAWRGCRRNPAFMLTAVITLALGIGANTAIVSALEAALWGPLPIDHPERLVTIALSRTHDTDETDVPASFAHQLRDSGIFASLVTNSNDGLSLTAGGPAERIVAEVVSSNYFEALGVRPIIGRDFTFARQPGRWAAEAILSYDFWRQRFGGDLGVIRRTIHLNSRAFTIVGIQPPTFFGLRRGSDYELRIPFLPDGQTDPLIAQISGQSDRWLDTSARLRPGQSLGEAQIAADVQLRAFLRVTPVEEFRESHLEHVRLVPGGRGNLELTGQFRTPLYLALALVATVFLVACANVAGLLLARGSARARELAVRASIGAGRSRLICQLLIESLLLSTIGGTIGVALAYFGTGLLGRLVPQGRIKILLDLHPDVRVVWTATGLAVIAGLLSGFVPAVQVSKGQTAAILKADSASATPAPHGLRLHRMLLVAQIAFSLLLLASADVFVQTLGDLKPSDYHVDPRHVLIMTMKPQQELYTDEARRILALELIRRMAAIPGVQSVALAENGPFDNRRSRGIVSLPGRDAVRVDTDTITPGFFATVGLAVAAGRDFTSRDRVGAPAVTVINTALAQILFPNANPIGQSFRVGTEPQSQFEVIGVVSDARYYDPHLAAQPTAWFAIGQLTAYIPTLHVRIEGEPSGPVVAEIRQIVNDLAPGVPTFNVRTMDDRFQDAVMPERMVALLGAILGLVSLILTAVGLYGAFAYSVVRRSREIGIRKALGSESSAVLWLVGREAFALTASGCLLGGFIALEASHIWVRYLATAHSITPSVMGACGLAVLVTVVAAVLVPSWRVLRVNPIQVLRAE